MKDKKRKKSPVSSIFSALGTILLILLIVGCLPLTLPRAFGYELYSVVSGSMEPEIPVGSLVFVKECLPEVLQEEEVIAFYGGKDSAAIITHRVVENQYVTGEIITKGDANDDNDPLPVDYENVIGKVEHVFPKLGAAAQFLTSLKGKIAAVSVIVAALLLNVIGGLFDREK